MRWVAWLVSIIAILSAVAARHELKAVVRRAQTAAFDKVIDIDEGFAESLWCTSHNVSMGSLDTRCSFGMASSFMMRVLEKFGREASGTWRATSKEAQ